MQGQLCVAWTGRLSLAVFDLRLEPVDPHGTSGLLSGRCSGVLGGVPTPEPRAQVRLLGPGTVPSTLCVAPAFSLGTTKDP